MIQPLSQPVPASQMQAFRAQAQQIGIPWDQEFSRIVELFGQPVIDLSQKLVQKGFNVSFVRDLVTKLEPPLLMVVMDFLDYLEQNPGDAQQFEQAVRAAHSRASAAASKPLAIPQNGFGFSVPTEVLTSLPAGERAGLLTGPVVKFVVKKYVLDPILAKLPENIRKPLVDNEDAIVGFIINLILGGGLATDGSGGGGIIASGPGAAPQKP